MKSTMIHASQFCLYQTQGMAAVMKLQCPANPQGCCDNVWNVLGTP